MTKKKSNITNILISEEYLKREFKNHINFQNQKLKHRKRMDNNSRNPDLVQATCNQTTSRLLMMLPTT